MEIDDLSCEVCGLIFFFDAAVSLCSGILIPDNFLLVVHDNFVVAWLSIFLDCPFENYVYLKPDVAS